MLAGAHCPAGGADGTEDGSNDERANRTVGRACGAFATAAVVMTTPVESVVPLCRSCLVWARKMLPTPNMKMLRMRMMTRSRMTSRTMNRTRGQHTPLPKPLVPIFLSVTSSSPVGGRPTLYSHDWASAPRA